MTLEASKFPVPRTSLHHSKKNFILIFTKIISKNCLLRCWTETLLSSEFRALGPYWGQSDVKI